ncbi:MAG: ClpXP protease specificity-enhancing factor [Shewanellaceae bacterium]|nr:ClpXP protease specificity-enhancing factor [Shewanellaceae bacterium]
MRQMTSNRSYLLKAYYDWISDNLLTPHILVNAAETGVQVPTDYVGKDQIILNILSSAVADLDINENAVSFQARFSGVPFEIYLPLTAIVAIYAQENGVGMTFFDEEQHLELDDDAELLQDSTPAKDSSSKTSHLRVIK